MMANYERILRVVILIDGLLGVVLLLWPGPVAGGPLKHGGGASTWGRGAGLFLILLSLALFAAAAQVLLGLFFAFSGAHLAWLLAIYLFVAAYLLFAAFWRGFQQYLMSKP